MTRSGLLFLLALLVAALLMLAAGTRTLAANPTIRCDRGPAEIVCTIAAGAGISAVAVAEQTSPVANRPVAADYPTCPAEVTVRWTPLAPNYALSVTDCAAAVAHVDYFAGLPHRPLGEANTILNPLSLAATGFDREGDDGLAVHLGQASLWSALLLPEAPPARGTFGAAVYPLGATTPAAQIQFTHHMTDVIVYPPSNSYDVRLFASDTLVYAHDAVPAGTGHVSLPAPFCDGIAALTTCVPRLTIGTNPTDNALYFELTLPRPLSLTTPTGPVSADRLYFVDASAARAPRSFERIELTATELPRLVIYDESVRAPLPAASLFLPALLGGTSADPFGFDALTAYMESDPPVGDSFRAGDDLSVRVVATGVLTTGVVLEPEPGAEPDDGSPDPQERPDLSAQDQTLRVFNTTLQKEFELELGADLLARLTAFLPGTGAHPPPDASLGVDSLLLRQRRGPAGWSDGVDNRAYLSGTTWWPWRTIVHFGNNCSGTLVGPRHILTAAHCINKRGTNQWYAFTVTPGRDGVNKPFGQATMDPNPQPGDPFRWYFTPAGWRDDKYSDAKCTGSCFAASQWDWGLIILPQYLGYQTGWMGYVARPASQLNYQAHFNRGYPVCNSSKGNSPAGCDYGELFGDTQTCDLGNYSYAGVDGWNRLIRNSCDLSGGHSGSAVYHYYYDPYLGQSVPVAAMVEVWEHCYTCAAGDDTPNTARRLTPGSVDIISFFRQWKP